MQYFNISIGSDEISRAAGGDGDLLADLVNEIGYHTDGDLGARVLAEFAEALNEGGRKVLVQLATAAGLIPEASHVDG